MKLAEAGKDKERRDYFRVDDVAILYHRVIGDDDVDVDTSKQLHIDKLTLKAKFENISRELQPLLKRISSGSPNIAEYLAGLDNKINLMSELIMTDEVNEMDVSPQQVNISAGGMSFYSEQAISKGSVLELKMVLLPDNTGIYSHAKVVSCKPNSKVDGSTEAFVIAVQFMRMNDEIRDVISRHVLATERAALAERRRD